MDAFRTLSSRAGFERFVQRLFTDKTGKYLGPEKFNQIKKPTASQEARNDSIPVYNAMNIWFARTFVEPTFYERWMEAFKKGFDNLISELQVKGPKYFMHVEDKDDDSFKYGKGGIFWDGIVKYLQHIGSKGFQKLVEKAITLPKEISAAEISQKKLLDIDVTES